MTDRRFCLLTESPPFTGKNTLHGGVVSSRPSRFPINAKTSNVIVLIERFRVLVVVCLALRLHWDARRLHCLMHCSFWPRRPVFCYIGASSPPLAAVLLLFSFVEQKSQIMQGLQDLMLKMMSSSVAGKAGSSVIGGDNQHQPPAGASLQAIVASETFNRPGLILAHGVDAAKAARIADDDSSAASTTASTSQSATVLRLKQSLMESTPSSGLSNKPLHELLPIQFTELRLGIVHHGFIVTGTLCTAAFRLSSIMTLLEDEQGRAIKLAIYNAVPSTCCMQEVQELFPEGARIAIRDPYFKRYVDCTVGLRVNNPGDIVFLSSGDDPSSTSAVDEQQQQELQESDYAGLRVQGNRLFASGDWAGAIKLYSRSIAVAEKELDQLYNGNKKQKRTETIHQVDVNSTSILNSCLHRLAKNPLIMCSKETPVVRDAAAACQSTTTTRVSSKAQAAADEYSRSTIKLGLVSAYSNRAEALLRMKRSREAFADARAALAIDRTHVKSVYRKGRALHTMGMFKEAVACFTEAVELAPNDYELQQALEEGLVSEQQSRGLFDLSCFFASEFSDKVPACADFVGPVRIGPSGLAGAGRGLFVTRDVGVGDLLLVSNPIAIARVTGSGSLEFHLDPVTRTMNDASQEDLVTQLYGLMKTAPEKNRIVRQLNCLFDGSSKLESPGEDLIKPELLSSLFQLDGNNSTTLDEELSIDVGKIRQIVQWNAFEERGFATDNCHKNAAGAKGLCSGLWFLPSFINHSCYPNASRIHVGDAMLIRASRDLKAGEEIFHPYTDIICPLRLRQQAIFNGWGFLCTCPRCMLEETLEDSLSDATDLYTALEDQAPPISSSNSSFYAFYKNPTIQGASWADSVAESSRIEAAIASLGAQERMWIRASFTLVFLVAATAAESEFPNRGGFMDRMLEAVVCVSPGDPQTLKLAAMIAEEVKASQGVNCEAYKAAEATAVHLCNAIFGKQQQHVTRSLIKACFQGLMDA